MDGCLASTTPASSAAATAAGPPPLVGAPSEGVRSHCQVPAQVHLPFGLRIKGGVFPYCRGSPSRVGKRGCAWAGGGAHLGDDVASRRCRGYPPFLAAVAARASLGPP